MPQHRRPPHRSAMTAVLQFSTEKKKLTVKDQKLPEIGKLPVIGELPVLGMVVKDQKLLVIGKAVKGQRLP